MERNWTLKNSIYKTAIALTWNNRGKVFHTITIADVDGLKFDSMLANSFMVWKTPVPREMQLSACRQYERLWMWGRRRGKAVACVGALNNPFECTGCFSSEMLFGNSFSNLVPFPPDRNEGCCKSVWVYAFYSPLASIEVSFPIPGPAGIEPGNIKFNVRGIGSKIYGKEILRYCR